MIMKHYSQESTFPRTEHFNTSRRELFILGLFNYRGFFRIQLLTGRKIQKRCLNYTLMRLTVPTLKILKQSEMKKPLGKMGW